MGFRRATISDAKRVAELHAESWRNTYRGILSDQFLDHEIFANRLSLWQKRLSEPQPESQLILLAEERGELLGFGCAFLDADPRWDALLDNLHIRVDAQGRGLGRRLMSEEVSWVLRHRPGSGLYLWVFEANDRHGSSTSVSTERSWSDRPSAPRTALKSWRYATLGMTFAHSRKQTLDGSLNF